MYLGTPVYTECYTCHCVMLLTQQQYDDLRDSKRSFYCLNGHSQHFTGKTPKDLEVDRLKLELAKKEREIADKEREIRSKDQEVRAAQREYIAVTLKLTEKDRTCPNCTKVYASVGRLQRHISTVHKSTKRLPEQSGPDAFGTNITRAHD